MFTDNYDVAVIGAGHAGVEAGHDGCCNRTDYSAVSVPAEVFR